MPTDPALGSQPCPERTLTPGLYPSESSGEEGSTVVRKERRRDTPNPMIQKVREPQQALVQPRCLPGSS